MSLADLQSLIGLPSHMPYARKGVPLDRVRWFQPVLDVVLRGGAVVMQPEKGLGPEVLYGYEDFYMYRVWRKQSAKELRFERRMRLREKGLFASCRNV